MDNKEFEQDESLEKTKELQTLRDIPLSEPDTLEYQKEFDEHMDDADLIFKTEVETKEEVKEELKQEVVQEKKENVFVKLKKKWNKLPKKNRIIILVVGILVLLLIIGLVVYFLCFANKNEEEKPKDPDVILEMDNYRYENGTLVILDGDEEVGRYECENKDEELCQVAYVNQDTVIDGTIKVDENKEPLVLRSSIYQDRYIFILDTKSSETKTIQLYDLEENQVIDTVFDVITSYDYPDYVILKDDSSEYGVMHFTTEAVETVIPYSYDEIHLILGEELKYVAVRKDNNSYLADLENKVLTKAFNTTIVGANDNYVKTKDSSGVYHVYDYNAREVNASTDQNYVALLDEIMIAVRSGKLYILDYEGNYYSNKELTLKNTSYNPIEIYKDLKLDTTEKAFDYELTNNILNINIYDGTSHENSSFDLNEGKLSKTISFLNYFDGTLYVYEDATKTSLIGSYHCTNRNSIDEGATTLNNCTIAYDSIYRETTGNTKEIATVREGAIPIIGKKYAFVKDGDTIYLVDLTNPEGKAIASYESVDTASYTGGNEITFVSPSSMPFIAKSKSSGNFGVARITSSGVEPVISFDKTSIKRLGEYYVVEENGKYALYNQAGEKETADKNSPIVDYYKNYLKTYKDNMYYVHTFEEDVSNTAYNYIELYDEYYAAVLNGRVHLYRYDDTKDEKTEYIYESDGETKTDGVKLNTTDYYGNEVNAFRITFDDEEIHVEIGNSNNTYNKALDFPVEVSND